VRELIGFALVCALIGASVWGRRRLALALDYPFFLKLIPVAVATGTTFVGVLYPFFYALISRAMNGGTFIANLPAGTGEEALFGLFTLGALSTMAAAIYGFWALLKS
jgi:hypothetical protein